MKKQTNTNLLWRSSFALALTLSIWLPTMATAADESMKASKHTMMDGKMMMTETNMVNQSNMMKHADMTNRIDGGNMTIHTNLVNHTSGKP